MSSPDRDDPSVDARGCSRKPYNSSGWKPVPQGQRTRCCRRTRWLRPSRSERVKQMNRHWSKLIRLAAAVCLVACAIPTSADDDLEPRLRLRDRENQPVGTSARSGSFRVYENREANTGRVLELDLLILQKLEQPGEPDPVFVFAGGPGQNVANHAAGWTRHWMRKTRDIVLLSQRGAGGNNRLTCQLPGSDDNLQGYLEPIFDEPTFRDCMKELQERFDLTHYSTPEAMDDVNDLREALGYDKINLYGGSYGSRAELVYLRRHPETVRCAIMNSVAPIAFKNPLFHAAAAQEALDRIFELTKANPKRLEAFGDLRKKFDTVIRRLEKKPAEATVKHPRTGEPVKVRLSRAAFAEALRVMMYYDYTHSSATAASAARCRSASSGPSQSCRPTTASRSAATSRSCSSPACSTPSPRRAGAPKPPAT